jgi:hypothetical protein
MFPDWRIIQSSPAYQNYVYVSVFPTSMRPSKLQKAFVQGYKVFLEKRLSSDERSYRMTKVKIWRRNLTHVLGRMQEYAEYLESVEGPYYDSNDELLEDRLKSDYYARVRRAPDHFENTPVIMRGAREEQLSR